MGSRCGCLAGFKPLLARAFNSNQFLILHEIAVNRYRTISAVLADVADERSIPLSTLKLNASILRELELVKFGGGEPAGLTRLGRRIVAIALEENNGNV